MRPDTRVRTAWKDYVNALCSTLSTNARHVLKETVLGRAYQVAEAAGGFLGLSSKVSRSEQAMLDELERAFP